MSSYLYFYYRYICKTVQILGKFKEELPWEKYDIFVRQCFITKYIFGFIIHTMYMTLVKWWVEPCFPPVSFPAREHAQSYLRYCVLNLNDFASTKSSCKDTKSLFVTLWQFNYIIYPNLKTWQIEVFYKKLLLKNLNHNYLKC